LKIEDCFDGMIDIYAMQPLCKPNQEAYQFALEISGVTNPKTCALLDDSPRNLATAKEMGFFTILVGQNHSHPAADCTLPDIHDLPKAVPEFWV
jgi:putative hydrolase of the HAD superfamily